MNREKLITVLLFVFFCSISDYCMAQNLIGKTYKNTIGQSCKERSDGGCWIVEYQVLAFQRDSVKVYSEIIGNCSPVDTSFDKTLIDLQIFPWSSSGDTLNIVGFKAFNALLIQGDKIIGLKGDDWEDFLLEK